MEQGPIRPQVALNTDDNDDDDALLTKEMTSTATATSESSSISDTALSTSITSSGQSVETARKVSSCNHHNEIIHNNDKQNHNNACVAHGPIRVISFDLDNTLWGTTPTIAAALQAVATFLESHGIPPSLPSSSSGGGGGNGTRTTESVMKELWQADKATYAPLLQERATCPALLTKLRQDALRHILIHDHGYDTDEATTLAQQAFAVMSDARHAAIPQHLATDVVESLTQLRRRLLHCRSQKNTNTAPVMMGAITDGNAHPGRVAALRPFFDFCIQAEAVGVGKPDGRIFQEAVRQVWPNHNVDNNKDCLHEWVHIGDDLRKDVVGAKAMGMRTIWCRELIQDKLRRDQNNNNNTTTLAKDLSSWNTTTTTSCPETEAVTTRRAITTTLNDDDVDDEACADAIVDRFADIVDVLETWHQQGQPK